MPGLLEGPYKALREGLPRALLNPSIEQYRPHHKDNLVEASPSQFLT